MKNNPRDQYVTESQLTRILNKQFSIFEENLESKIDQKFQKFSDDILEVIRDFSDRVDERFNRLEAMVDGIAVANQARDAQLTRHERWHYRIANKLNIDLNPEV